MTQATRRMMLAGTAALLSAVPTLLHAQEVLGGNTVTGAGSTFAYPVLSRWAHGYRRFIAGGGDFPIAGAGLEDPPTAPAIDYEPIGSMAGIMRVKEAAVDFGATDVPLSSTELGKLGLAQFPIVIGGVAVAVNLDGVKSGQIRFNGSVLADIFLGKVATWSDPAIAALNPGLKLPDAKIVIVRRGDGSGTTFNFTDYLSQVSPQWKADIGADLFVKWPGGVAAKGNEGMAKTVRSMPNSIGYVEFAQAMRAKLSIAQIENRAHQFVVPAPARFQAAAASADWAKSGDFNLLLTDAPGESAYPIVATVFAVLNKSLPQRRARATLNFFRWSLDKGAADASALGYVPLPEPLTKQVKAYWTQNFKSAAS